MTTSTLTLLWTPLTVAIAVVAFVVTAVFSSITWRRSGYRKSIAALELLRLAIVAIGGVLLNQPEWIEEYRPEEKPSVAILCDASTSMDTRDALNPASPTQPPVVRREAIEALTRQETWAPLAEQYNVVVQTFDSGAPTTDLAKALAGASDDVPNLVGVVLASDGDWNAGAAPVEGALRLAQKKTPVVVLPVGSRTRIPDVELLSLDLPTFGVAGKEVRVPFTIDSSLPREFVATVHLKAGEGEEITHEVRVNPHGRTSDAILWKPAGEGDYTVTLTVTPHRDETLLDNNELTAPIAIRQEKLKVLVIESYPRWEYRYLRNALSRDPGVEVSCLLFHPGLSKVGGGNKDYIKAFPAGLDELAQYDVVFLGDVGIEEGQLTSEQCHLLKGLVEQQASGLVFMPGWQGRQHSLLETDLGELYPVVLDEAQPGGWGSRLPNQFELTELGQRSLLTKLADTREDNNEVWDSLPGFQWYAAVIRAKAGTEVLAVHKDVSNQYGRLPLLTTRTYGAGKVLFMGTDGAWRWRKGVEDKYHYRFWGQVVRWMAYQRNMAKGESMRLYYSPDQPQLRQTLSLSANVMETSGEPLAQGDVVARIVAPSGKGHTVRFESTGVEWGAFAGRFVPEEPGKHEITLTCRQTEGTLEASFYVQGSLVEPIGRPARPEVLEEIARVTKGKILDGIDPEQVMAYLASLPEPDPAIRRVQIWSHPVVAGIVIGLLGVFWVCRKIVGLI